MRGHKEGSKYEERHESARERKREGDKPKGKRSKAAMNSFAAMAKKRKRG